MNHFRGRLSDLAERQMEQLYEDIADAADPDTAFGYVERIRAFCHKLEALPERGTLRDNLRLGLRAIRFERRVTSCLAFTRTLY